MLLQGFKIRCRRIVVTHIRTHGKRALIEDGAALGTYQKEFICRHLHFAPIAKVIADKNTVGNKPLADYATAEKAKAIEGSTPQYKSSGKAADCEGFHRKVALLFTLLTFCPPGPLERAKENCSSSSESVIRGVTSSDGMGLFYKCHGVACAIG